MNPLRPHVRSAPVFQLPARRPLGARVGAAHVGAVYYSPFETAQYARRVDAKIRALKKDYEAAYPTKPSPTCSGIADCTEKFNAWKAAMPTARRNMEDFYYRWENFKNEYFDSDLTIKSGVLYPSVVMSPVGGVAYHYWKATNIYEETLKYDVEADGFAKAYQTEFGKAPPTVPVTVSAKDVEEKKKETEGSSSILSKISIPDMGISGLLTTAAVIFVAGAFIISRAK